MYFRYIYSMGKSSLYKGSLQTIILKMLEENGRMYGYQITQQVKEMTSGDYSITEGALYPALHKLEADGLVETQLENAGNRLRKYYSLTNEGEKVMADKLEELKRFVNSMNILLKPGLNS